jgi:hypothetical protein
VAVVDPPRRLASTSGVVFFVSGFVLGVLGVFAFAFLAADTWRRGFPLSFQVFAAAGMVVAAGGTLTSIEGIRLQARGSIPHPRDGVLVLRLPDSMRPGNLVSSIGGGIGAVGGAMVIGSIITDTPALTAVQRAAGVAALVVLYVCLVAWLFVATRMAWGRFVVDSTGLRWDNPFRLSSVRIPWDEVARIEHRWRWSSPMRIVVTTRDGRSRRIRFSDPSIPLSRDAARAVVSDIEALRPTTVQL